MNQPQSLMDEPFVLPSPMHDPGRDLKYLDATFSKRGNRQLFWRPPGAQPVLHWEHPDGPLLVCHDGTCVWLGLLEALGVRAGWLHLEQLDRKYNSEPRQSAG